MSDPFSDPCSSTSYPPPQPANPSSAPSPGTSNSATGAATGPQYNIRLTDPKKNLKCCDSRLSKDPQALEQFLLTHASKRPTVLILCRGTHEEEGTDSDGNKTTNIVEDFNFAVDITSALLPPNLYAPPIWVVADEEPAKRGRCYRQIELDPNPSPNPPNLEAGTRLTRYIKRKATPLERKQALEDAERRTYLALPPWACISAQTPDPTGARLLLAHDRRRLEHTAIGTIDDFSDGPLPAPSKTLRAFVEEYCAAMSPLKEFRFMRTVYGWDFAQVERDVAASLAGTHGGDGKKEFAKVVVRGGKIIVRPQNAMWSVFGIGLIKVFLCITLIYPLIMWPLKKFVLGSCWKVAGSSFAFMRYEHLADSMPGETVAQYVARVPDAPPVTDLKVTPRGVAKIVGQRFADWYPNHRANFVAQATKRTKTRERNPLVV